MDVTHNHLPLVRINAPEFYHDPDFVAWLNDPERQQAAWHRKGQPPGAYSDLFFAVSPADAESDADGSDSDMPEHIWRQICAAVPPGRDCLVWLTNLE